MTTSGTEQVRDRAVALLQTYQRIAARMYTLDSHAGRRFLRDSPVTGVTADLAREVNRRAPVVWAQFDELRRLTDPLPPPDGYDGLSATDLAAVADIVGRTDIALDADGVPTDASQEPVHSRESLADFVDRIDTECTVLLEKCTDADTACGAVADVAAGIRTTLDDLVAVAEALGMSGNAKLASLRARHDKELAAALSDPLTAAREDTLAPLARDCNTFATELAGLRDIRRQHPERIAALDRSIAALSVAEQEAGRTCDAVAVKIGNPPVPAPPAEAARLSAALSDARTRAEQADWFGLADQLTTIERQVEHAEDRCRQTAAAATALLDRRAELRGRFSAYTRKAARIGVIEEPAVAEAAAVTRELLSTAPCDLPAATVALHRFQQAMTQ